MHTAHITFSSKQYNCTISIGGRKISNLRYADNTTLIAADEEEMAEMIDRVKTVSGTSDTGRKQIQFSSE